MKALVYNGPRDVSVSEVCPVKAYNRYLRDLIHTGKASPSFIVSHQLPLAHASEGYQHFDARDNGWTKVVLSPHGGNTDWR